MNPPNVEIDRQPNPPCPKRELSLDMAIAAETPVPVLISAPAERALPIAIAIAASAGAHRPDDILVVESATARTQISSLLKAREAGRGHRVVLLRNIEAFDRAQQSMVVELLDHAFRPDAARCRVITTTSVWLLNQVADGSFDSHLFYKLNAIHIRP
jgi:type IV secretory pathway protease TraF